MTLFLSAQWKYLVMINYEIDPTVLLPYLPKGTELDLWKGKTLMSLVGFMFYDMKVKEISIPFHRHFEEVNLRFYVKHDTPEGRRHGVVFIKEIVPRYAIAFAARYFYHENYVSLPMGHRIELADSKMSVSYEWQLNKTWQKISMCCTGNSKPILPSSEEEFITERYWGYNTQRNGKTMTYQVEHPRWRMWSLDQLEVSIDALHLYGPAFAPFLEKPPTSAFLVDGSAVKVYSGHLI